MSNFGGYGLGTKGWIIYFLMVLFNLPAGVATFDGIGIVGYVLFIIVGGYIWIRFLKWVLQYLGFLKTPDKAPTEGEPAD